MNTISRRSILIFFLLCSVSFAVKAQFLGQQSLSESSYVIDQSGQLWAWGDNFYGQLGVGDRVNRNTPTLIPVPVGASKWVLVAGGANFAIAVADSDKLYTWGLNDKGQIGNGVPDGLYAVPTRIQNPPYITNWKWVSAGAAHCEALTTDGRLFAWGDNTQGELGVGTTQYIITPQQVQFPTGVPAWEDVAAGPGYTMMISQGGLLYCCGIDSLGAFKPSEGPIQSQIDTVRALSPLPCIAASYQIESRIEAGAYAYNNFYVGSNGSSPETMAAIAAGGYHTVFLTSSGSVITTGDNTYGQLGVGPGAYVQIGNIKFPTGVTQFVAVAAGLRHSLAIGNDGWLYAWGDNSVGELGIGADTSQNEPVKVLKVCPPLAVSASFIAPSEFSTPFSVTLNVKDVSSGTLLTNGDAFLLIGPPLYLDSVPDETVPSPIPSNDTIPLAWGGSVNAPYYSDFNSSYFAYIRADGSAPLLVSATADVITEPWSICNQADVLDTLTLAPIPDAEFVFPGAPVEGCEGLFFDSPLDSNKMFSDENGDFSLCFHGPLFIKVISSIFGNTVTNFPFNVMRENYQTVRFTPVEPLAQQFKIFLSPSFIQGTFALPAPPFVADSIVKVYYPDSLIGYALSRRVIFQTLDSGITWSALYVADADLHDVKFRDPAHGWAVGGGGEILSTTDSGETWLVTHIGRQNLRALFVIDADTAWAVGDNGTILRKSGNTWTADSVLGPDNLQAINFLDPEDGVIGGNGVYYVYDSGIWIRNTIGADVRSVCYSAPGRIYFAGTNGAIINYSAFFCDTLIADSTYTAHTINSLYFLNPYIGYAVGDSGSSFVTYDTGNSWADMSKFPSHTATSVNFFSLAGHGASDSGILNYTGMPSSVTSIVRGRLTFGNPPEPILGAEVDRIYASDTLTNLMDITYTNDQGNFVFTGIDSVFPYEYQINFMDSGIAKTKIFSNVQAERHHEIITLNYNDYTPPLPDTTLSVSSVSEAVLSLHINVSGSIAQIEYNIPSGGPTQITMLDILGRTVRTISDGFTTAGSQETDVSLDGLPTGAYFVTLISGEGSLTKKLVVLQ